MKKLPPSKLLPIAPIALPVLQSPHHFVDHLSAVTAAVCVLVTPLLPRSTLTDGVSPPPLPPTLPNTTTTNRCAVIDDRTIRDGLIHAMASRRNTAVPSPWYDSNRNLSPLGQDAAAEGLGHGHHPQAPQPDGEEYKRGQALECALFSSIAIGGLMVGCPVDDVACYLASAQRCREQLDGLKDRSAVSALILHAVSHAFLGAEKVR